MLLGLGFRVSMTADVKEGCQESGREVRVCAVLKLSGFGRGDLGM